MTDRAPQTWLVIFDPSLKSLDGHSHNYDHAIATAATARFDRVVVCAERAFALSGEGAMALHPIANSAACLTLRRVVDAVLPRRDSGALPNAPTPGVPGRLERLWLDFRAYEIATSLERTLRTLDCSDADRVHVFIQHADHNELAAAERFVHRHRRRVGRLTLHLLLRHDPAITRSNRESAAAFADRLLRLTRARNPAVRFMTDSELIAGEYRALTEGGMPISVVPIPVALSAQPPSARDEATAPAIARIAILGASRMEKGFGNVIEIYSNLPARLADVRVHFAVQVNRTSPDPSVRGVIARLDEAARERREDRPVVEVLEGPATEAEYASWFRRIDILLMPYASPKYRASTSGVFVEAMHVGVPCIVAEDTWMAAQIEEASRLGFELGTATDCWADLPTVCDRVWTRWSVLRESIASYASSRDPEYAASTIVSAILDS